MAFTRISNSQINSRGATTLPNQPQISAAALKEEFDAPAKQIVAPAVNNLMDELEASTSAGNLGAVAPTGRTGSTVQGVMNGISTDLAAVEADIPGLVAAEHTHDNKLLLDTYDQSNDDIKQAITDDHTHANKSLLDSYSQTEANLADAVSKKHDHSNKSLLDSYSQTEANLADAVTKKHEHSNKSLLDSYSQTEANLADAVSKKHEHSNKAVLDKFSESAGGDPLYDGDPIGGGAVNDAYKKVKVGTTEIVASGEDTLTLVAGSNITLTPDAENKKVTLEAAGGGGGGGTGDMSHSDYDSDYDVKTAGGIKAYVSGAIAGKQDTLTFDSVPTDGSTNPVESNGIYDAIEQIYADNGVLGAKNLLPNNATSQTVNGVTFTVNEDGSVTANGTATASTDLIVSRDLPLLYGGRYILSGCPSGGAVSKYRITAYRVESIDGQSGSLFDIGDGLEFTYKNMTGNVLFIIYIENGVTVNNLTFYPMLRLASDPDDTYVPYAMTNRELTENVSAESLTINLTASDKATKMMDNSRRCGNVVNIRIQLQVTSEIANNTKIFRLDGLPHPGYAIAILGETNEGTLIPLMIGTSNSDFIASCRKTIPVGYYAISYTYII